MWPKSTQQNRGFTLIELLVVVSIIALLISILLPSLRSARKQAKTVVCTTNQHGLGTAAFTYLTEWNRLPPSLSNFQASGLDTYRGALDWLGVGDDSGIYQKGDPKDPQSGSPRGFDASPNFGALWPYAGQEGIYLCPEDRKGKATDTTAGGGGNGKFSYRMFATMGLRTMDKLPLGEIILQGGTRGGPKTKLRTRPPLSRVPLFVEEHPRGNMEGNFNTSIDYVALRHGPMTKRLGRPPGRVVNEPLAFKQGTCTMGFADGHAEVLRVNYGITGTDILPTTAGGLGLSKLIPYNADGLLQYFGLKDGDYVKIIQ